MKSGWFLFMDLDGGDPYIFRAGPPHSQGFGEHIFSSFVEYPSRYLYVPGSLALNCISKFAGALLLWFASGSSSNIPQNLSRNHHGSRSGSSQSCQQAKHSTFYKRNIAEFCFGSKLRAGSAYPVLFSKIASSTMRNLLNEVEQLQSFPVLSLAAALVPPFEDLYPKVLDVPVENTDVNIKAQMDQVSCICERGGSADLSFSEIKTKGHVVEPVTGINFPTVLYNIVTGENSSTLTSEILVGTGSKSLRIIKIKSLRVYAFGLYVQPNSICEKLRKKYASVPVDELSSRSEFFDDLLREDIHMTVRLVVNCNGLKINTVRDTFEKSLRARLLKMNPNTDYYCLRTFGSIFPEHIPLPVGTTIDFQQTADGRFITEIGGKRIGAVHSKDLCRAFFDMYLGDVPISLQTKEEIARNIASIIRRC